MDNTKTEAKHAQETRSNRRLWRKPWRRSKTGLKGHRASHTGNNPNVDQPTTSGYDAWHGRQLSPEFPILSSAAKAAYSLGAAVISVHAAEMLEHPKLQASSSTSSYREQSALPSRRSETRLKTLEEEAVSAALAAAAATAAAAAERARIAAQAALAIQAEQEMEAEAAMEEARVARDLAAQLEKDDKKQSHQSELGSFLLPKRRRVPKNRAPRSGSMSQPPPSLSEQSIAKRDPAAPIHSRPPPPMVSPRFAAKLVELVSTAGPLQMPQISASKPTQKRASVTRKGAHPMSPPVTNPVVVSQPSTNRLPTATPTTTRSHRPNHTVPPQPPASAHHTSPPTASTPQYNPAGGHQIPSRSPTQQFVSPVQNHPPPPPMAHPPQQPTTSTLRPPQTQQPPQTHQSTIPPSSPSSAPQTAPQYVPQPALQHVPQPALQHVPQPALQHVPQPAPQHVPQPAPQHVPQPAPQYVPQPAPQYVTQPAPQPSSQPNQQINRPERSSAPNARIPLSNPMPSYERATNQTEQSQQNPYGVAAGMAANNNSERPSYQQPLTINQPQSQPQAARPLQTSIPSINYPPPASHLYGTLPRKNQALTNALAPNINSSPDLAASTQPTSMPHVTLAMLPNTDANPNQWVLRQLPEAAKPRTGTSNQRPSSATRPSVGTLLRSGVRSLNRNSLSAAALDHPKPTETSVAWNSTKIAAPADDSATAFTDTILPPCDLADNDPSLLYHDISMQPTMVWPPSWQNTMPVFNEAKPNLESETKQGMNAWQQESYHFPLDIGPALTRGRVSQTTLEDVNQSSSLGSLPQPYMPMETMASHNRQEPWWQKAPVDMTRSGVHWDKSVSSAPTFNRPGISQPPPVSQSPCQPTNNPPSTMPNWTPTRPTQIPAPWQNQSAFEDRERRRSDVSGGGSQTIIDNSVKTSIHESPYQQTLFSAYDSGPYHLSPQQHYPETVLEETSVGDDPQ